jgi:hypothetical protein
MMITAFWQDMLVRHFIFSILLPLKVEDILPLTGQNVLLLKHLC